MNNLNTSAAIKQVDENSQSHTLSLQTQFEKLQLASASVSDYKQAQQLLKPKSQTNWVIEQYQCTICKSKAPILDKVRCRANFRCVHCNLEFNTETQCLEHGHTTRIKTKYKLMEEL